MRLRIAWGGGSQRLWQGQVSVDRGTLDDPACLGIEADSPATLWPAGPGKLNIRARSPRTYDGLDVTVTGPADAVLHVDVRPLEALDHAEPVEIALAQLVADSHSVPLDEGGNRLFVRRAPGDELRTLLARDHLVFAPGEPLALQLEPHLLPVAAGTRLDFDVDLYAAGSSRSVWSEQHERDVPEDGTAIAPMTLAVPLPRTAGVYELFIRATPRRLRNRLGFKQAVAERRVQVVVVDSAPAAPTSPEAPMDVVAEIDPLAPRLRDRLAKLPLVPGTAKGTLSSGQSRRWPYTPDGMVQIGGTSAVAGHDIVWEAYELSIDQPGVQHILEVEYPSNVAQATGISIVEPDASGAVAPIGLDSGVYVEPAESDQPPRVLTHRLPFWPRTANPWVLVTNRAPGTPSVYGKLRVLVAESGLPAPSGSSTTPQERLVAGYMDRPLFPENFAAPGALDSWSGRVLDDWNTFYRGANRLTAYLEHAGYNGLMMSVLADGSAVYPSRRLMSTPRYDTGTFFASGQDPVRKDVLELLLRTFERRRLRLIPALEFAAPLPQLEAMLRAGGGDVVGIELIGADGRTWVDRHPQQLGTTTYYNVLNPRVQEAMLDVVRELAERYGRHAAFAGVALQLSPHGYAQLPGVAWALDDDTVGRFERDVNVQLPDEVGNRFAIRAELLSTEYRRQWLAWRARELAKFYQRVQLEVVRNRRDAKLYLATATLFDGREARRQLRPTLPRRTTLETALAEAGIDPRLYGDQPGIVLLRPNRFTPAIDLAGQAIDVQINDSAELDRYLQTAVNRGSLLYCVPQQARLASFDARSPYRNTYTWLVSHLSPSAERNRARFVHSLAALDAEAVFDGGWMLPLGQADWSRDAVLAYRRLPAQPFESIGDTQPVTIRRARTDRGTFVYLANDSPWPASVHVDVVAPPSCEASSLTDRPVPALRRGDRGSSWSVDLAPHDVLAVMFSGNAELENPTVELTAAVQQELQQRIADLGARANALATAPPLDGIENADFEQPPAADGSIPGWFVDDRASVRASIEGRSAHGGRQSLLLVNTEGEAGIASPPFESPPTGRLSMWVWLRTADTNRQPPLRLVVEGMHAGELYRRYAPVGAGIEGRRIGSDWTPFKFEIVDLPFHDLEQLRVRFEMTGAGQVSIDDVRLSHLSFSEYEQRELRKIITLAHAKLAAEKFTECQRVLDGYWPRFLEEHVPITPQRTARNPFADIAPQPEPQAAEESPGILDRMKRLLPRSLRF